MASNFSPMYFEQPIVIIDTTESLYTTSGAFVLYGGMSINATYDSATTSTGAFILSGGMGIQKQLNVGGITHIKSTTETSGIASGALVVSGGVGIGKSLHIGEDTFIAGNLYVNGVTTSVNTTTLNISDNTLMLNSGPSGSRDSGVLIQRYQTDVDDGTGDVVGPNEPIVESGAFSVVTDVSTLTFVTANPSLDPTGWWIKVTSGAAEDNVRQIASATNDGTNVDIVLSTPLTTLPSVSDTFGLYNRNFVAQYYDESNDEYIMGYISDAQDIQINLSLNDLLNIRAKGLYAQNSTITNLSVTTLTAGSIGIDSASLSNATITNLVSSFITSGSLDVVGPSLLQGAVTAGALNVTGNSILQGMVTAGALNVTGESFLQGAVTAGTINIIGDSILQGMVTAGALTVTGQSFLQGAVTAGSVNIIGDSILQGMVTTGALTVTGQSFLQGAVTAGSVNIIGDSILQGMVTAGALNVTGDSILQGMVTAGALTVTGNSTLQGSVTAGSFNVIGAANLQGGLTTGSLYVTGATLLGSYVTITTPTTGVYDTVTPVTGGSLLINTVDVIPSLGDISRERQFTIPSNPITVPSDVTGFVFNNAIVRAFDAVVSVTILTTGGVDKYAYYNLKGIQKGSNWVLNSSYVGDVTGLTFSIDNGQIKYTSTSVANFDTGYINFRALTTTVNV